MDKLLYIDDEKHNLLTLQVSLKRWYEVFTLDNPMEALELIEREQIGVVITDQRMPGMTGLELAEKIQEKFEDVIVIILTAYDDSNVMLKAINQGGIFRYMLKPWDIKELQQTLKNAFDTYALRIKNRHLVNDLLKHNRELSLQERKYRLIFDHSPLGIAHIDASGYITRHNRRFKDITHLAHEQKNLKALAKGLNIEIYLAFDKSLKENKSVTFEGKYHLENGKEMPVRAIFTPIKEGDTNEGVVVLVEDLSEILMQEELRNQVTIAKEAARFKQNFLAEMSHEIRTPLTGVLGMIDILNKSELTPLQSEHVAMLWQTGKDLRDIINQVLDYSKIEAGKIPLNKTIFRVSNILSKAEKLFFSICNKNITFQIQHDPQVPQCIEGDELRIMQILNNLITNAVKFTQEGSITLTSELVSGSSVEEGCTIKFSVTDTGKGIPEEMQKILFTPFTQIDEGQTTGIEGTGLGLAICKELAKLHGGEVGLESHPGKGSIFWFTIKAKGHAEAVSDEPEPDYRDTHMPVAPVKILFAEDNRVIQSVIKLLLEDHGHQVTLANNGADVIKKYVPDAFDLILMDIQMPVMNGIDATEMLREAHENLPPVVGLTANALEGDREKFMGMGLDEYLTKPFDLDDFYKVLKKFDLVG